MVGVLLIAHEPIAAALAAGARHVYACAPERGAAQLGVLDIAPGADVAGSVETARRMVRSLDDGQGVLVLTDVFGATPGNVAAQLVEPGKVAVVAGLSLPMLLRALCYREGRLADTVDKAIAGGTQGVMNVAATSVQNQAARGASHDPARLQDQQ